MSIKQGDYLKQLRIQNKMSQEKLGECLGLSRQSVSKWEQGYATPDTENLLKLSELYNIPVDTILKCGETEESSNQSDKETEKENAEENQIEKESAEEKKTPELIFIERPPRQENKTPKKRGWFFISFPIIMAIAYIIIGLAFGAKGWITGWIVFLTIPLFYTGIFAFEKKKPIIFCYPVLVLTVYLLLGFFASLWHPMWILFLTIPIFYIVCAVKKSK